MFFWQIEQMGREILTRAGADSPGLSSRLLLEYVSAKSQMEYIVSRREEAPAEIFEKFCALLARRKKGEPLAYITGQKEFYGRNFFVNQACLIPRPETELLVELALELISPEKCVFLDACCGSGCIGLSLLAERKKWKGFLLDKFVETLKMAQKNAKNLEVDAAFLAGDIFQPPFTKNCLDLVISNPPYISWGKKTDVMFEVFNFEPQAALFSPEQGLSHIKHLARLAFKALRPGGLILLEHGFDQARQVKDILQNQGFGELEAFRDLANLPRCAKAKKLF